MLNENEIQKMYEDENLTMAAIAGKVGKSKATICNLLNKIGYRKKPAKFWMTEDRKKQMRENLIGRPVSRETREKISIANRNNYSSAEKRAQISMRQRGPLGNNWKGGLTKRENRYMVYMGPGKYSYHARFLIENLLGRKLRRNEDVHHINLDRSDDRIENLMMCSRSEHKKIHMRLKRERLLQSRQNF